MGRPVNRRTIKIELGRFSATLTASRVVREAITVTGARWMWHATRTHREGTVQVPRGGDLDDLLAALEADGQRVEIASRAVRPDSRRTGAGQRWRPGVTRDGEIGEQR